MFCSSRKIAGWWLLCNSEVDFSDLSDPIIFSSPTPLDFLFTSVGQRIQILVTLSSLQLNSRIIQNSGENYMYICESARFQQLTRGWSDSQRHSVEKTCERPVWISEHILELYMLALASANRLPLHYHVLTELTLRSCPLEPTPKISKNKGR